LHEIKEQHQKEIRYLEQEFENTKKRLLMQIESLTEKNNELEMRVKFEVSDLSK